MLKDFMNLTKREQDIARLFGHVGLVASRPSMREAFDYLEVIGKGTTYPVPVITAGLVLHNTATILIAETVNAHHKRIKSWMELYGPNLPDVGKRKLLEILNGFPKFSEEETCK